MTEALPGQRAWRSWQRSTLREAEQAHLALLLDNPDEAVDRLLEVWRILDAHWPADLRSAVGLDHWFGLHADGPSAWLMTLMRLRQQPNAAADGRGHDLRVAASGLISRLTADDPLRDEAELTEAVLALVLGSDPSADTRARGLLARRPGNAWVRLSLADAYWTLAASGQRQPRRAEALYLEVLALEADDPALAERAHDALQQLYAATGQHDTAALLGEAFFTPERVVRALLMRADQPSEHAIRAALRLGSRVVEALAAVVTDPPLWRSYAADDAGLPIWWGVVHAALLLGAIGDAAALPALATALDAELPLLRAHLPAVFARFGAPALRPLRHALNDRGRPPGARQCACHCIAATGLATPAVRADGVATLRAALARRAESRALRTAAAYGLALLGDRESRGRIVRGLGSGRLDASELAPELVADLYAGRLPAEPLLALDRDLLAFYSGDERLTRDHAARDHVEMAAAALLDLLDRAVAGDATAAAASAPPRARAGVRRADHWRRALAAIARQATGDVSLLNALADWQADPLATIDDVERQGLDDALIDFWTLDAPAGTAPCPADLLVAERRLMSLTERAELEAWRAAEVRLFEVTTARSELPAVGRDLASGESLELYGAFELPAVPHDLYLGRVVAWPGEAVMLYPLRLPPRLAPALLAKVRRGDAAGPSVAPANRRRGMARLHARMARECTPEGGGLLPPAEAPLAGSAYYDVRDREQALAVLRTLRGWHDSGATVQNESDFRRSSEPSDVAPDGLRLAADRVRLRHDRLVLTCASHERLGDARRVLERALGRAVRHRADVLEDPLWLFASPRLAAPGDASEARATLLCESLERHYAAWLDRPHPELAGRTPREAAGDLFLREPLLGLLTEIENVEARRGLRLGVRWQTAPLRRQLGLPAAPDRPGSFGSRGESAP